MAGLITQHKIKHILQRLTNLQRRIFKINTSEWDLVLSFPCGPTCGLSDRKVRGMSW